MGFLGLPRLVFVEPPAMRRRASEKDLARDFSGAIGSGMITGGNLGCTRGDIDKGNEDRDRGGGAMGEVAEMTTCT